MINSLTTLLQVAAKMHTTITYRDVATSLNLQPPQTINQATTLLENLMRQHVAENKPILASLVISQIRAGLPAHGYFQLLNELGVYSGSVDDEDAVIFHQSEVERVFEYWGK
jgi:hypothetical protein